MFGPGCGVADRFVVADEGRITFSAPFRPAYLATHRLLDAAFGVKALLGDGKPEHGVAIDADEIKILQRNPTATTRQQTQSHEPVERLVCAILTQLDHPGRLGGGELADEEIADWFAAVDHRNSENIRRRHFCRH
jgi:hypothetical protein